jgi:hypothetical protein
MQADLDSSEEEDDAYQEDWFGLATGKDVVCMHL